jgi:hypothetical protein
VSASLPASAKPGPGRLTSSRYTRRPDCDAPPTRQFTLLVAHPSPPEASARVHNTGNYWFLRSDKTLPAAGPLASRLADLLPQTRPPAARPVQAPHDLWPAETHAHGQAQCMRPAHLQDRPVKRRRIWRGLPPNAAAPIRRLDPLSMATHGGQTLGAPLYRFSTEPPGSLRTFFEETCGLAGIQRPRGARKPRHINNLWQPSTTDEKVRSSV